MDDFGDFIEYTPELWYQAFGCSVAYGFDCDLGWYGTLDCIV